MLVGIDARVGRIYFWLDSSQLFLLTLDLISESVAAYVLCTAASQKQKRSCSLSLVAHKPIQVGVMALAFSAVTPSVAASCVFLSKIAP